MVGARVCLVLAHRRRLPEGVEHLNRHRSVDRVREVASVAASELVRTLDALVLPVGPVDVVFKHRDREDVRQLVADDVAHVRSVEVSDRDVVDRQRVRPAEEIATNDARVQRAVHAEPADVRVVTPVCVEEETAERVDSDGARLL